MDGEHGVAASACLLAGRADVSQGAGDEGGNSVGVGTIALLHLAGAEHCGREGGVQTKGVRECAGMQPARPQASATRAVVQSAAPVVARDSTSHPFVTATRPSAMPGRT